MADLIANKAFTYANRRLLPGQDFSTKSERDANLLIAIGKARPRRVPGSVPPPPKALATKIASAAPAEDLTALRAAYLEATGKRPFNGWDAATLRSKIEQATAS